MATITKRGRGWFAQVRRRGYAGHHRTFRTKAEAQAWTRELEAKIDRQEAPVDLRGLRACTLGDVLRRYLTEVTPRKRSAETERLRIEKMLRDPLFRLSLADLTPQPLAEYRDRRLSSVKPGTVRRELSLINHALDTANREWGLTLPRNPVRSIRQPTLNNSRDRRVRGGELPRLDAALAQVRNAIVAPVVRFAIATALRRSEILSLEWRHVSLVTRTAHIPWSKTGKARTIPLTDEAIEVLAERAKDGMESKVFPMSANAFRLAWERARRRAGLGDLRFHDLRHEAISRFCELGLTLPEVAVISGHRDPRMLFRYINLRPTDLAMKLAGRSWSEETASMPSRADRFSVG